MRDTRRGSSRSVTNGRRNSRFAVYSFSFAVVQYSSRISAFNRKQRPSSVHPKPSSTSSSRTWKVSDRLASLASPSRLASYTAHDSRKLFLLYSPAWALILKIKSSPTIVLSIAFNNHLHKLYRSTSDAGKLLKAVAGTAGKVDAPRHVYSSGMSRTTEELASLRVGRATRASEG